MEFINLWGGWVILKHTVISDFNVNGSTYAYDFSITTSVIITLMIKYCFSVNSLIISFQDPLQEENLRFSVFVLKELQFPLGGQDPTSSLNGVL